MNWQMVWEAFKGAASVTPIFLCVLFSAFALHIGIKEYGWMVAAKVAGIFVVGILFATAFSLALDWILHWGK